MEKHINLLQPSCGDREIAAVSEVLKSGWLGSGPKVAEFEKKFAEFVGSSGCLAVNSCTSALHLAVRAVLKRKMVDKPNIIVPSLTFVSTGLAGLYEGVEVRFADIDNYCMSVESAMNLIDDNTVAIIPVHYGGITAPVMELRREMDRLHINIPIIEDCAHATGNPDVGKYGLMSCWSFHPVKNLATGDMGAITYNLSNKPIPTALTEEEIENIIQERWCGINLDTFKREKGGYNWEYNIKMMGFKYNTNDIMASIALVQLDRIWELNGKRRIIADRYDEAFSPIVGRMERSGSNHLYVIQVGNGLRNSLIEFLRSKGISPGVHYKPIHTYPIWGHDTSKYNLTTTNYVASRIISLPIHPELTKEDQDRVIAAVKEFFKY